MDAGLRRPRGASGPQYRRGSIYLEDSADVGAYAELFDHLRARALGPDESRALIARLAEETS
jgi:hypothetical protein